MNGMLKPPAATAFDAAASIVLLAVTLGVALAAVARASRDVRARLFLVVALTSVIPYLMPVLQWRAGMAAYTARLIGLAAFSFALGSVALFHFTQVFPRRRPWIAAHRWWLVAAYVVLPVPVAAIAWSVGALNEMMAAADAGGSGGLGAVSSEGGIALFLLMGIPAIFIVGIVLPCAGLFSLFKSWQEAKARGDAGARSVTFWMLMSQMAGGVLTVLVLPMLQVVGIAGVWATIVGALAFGFALIMPLALAAAVWKYRL